MPAPNHHPSWWIPTVYFAEGLPYVMVNSVAGIAMLRLGWSAAQVAAYTSGLSLPWALKPLWAPLVEWLGTRRAWVVAMQAGGAVLLVVMAVVLPEKSLLIVTLGLLTGLAIVSATHDMAADGFYMAALDEHRQAEWTGLRNTFYRVAMLAGSFGLVGLAGWWEPMWGVAHAWTATFCCAAVGLAVLAIYHYFVLPQVEMPAKISGRRNLSTWASEFGEVWTKFLLKPGLLRILAFLLLYRFAEQQVQKGNTAFFLANVKNGGLGLKTAELGYLYGGMGVVSLLVGGIVGGLAIARWGLRRLLWPMAAAMNLPNLFYVWMAWTQPQNRAVIGGFISVEQFGYGFGFAAFMVYLLYVARGEHATAHYAMASGINALGLTFAGLVAAAALKLTSGLPSGGYLEFFLWVMVCTLISFAVLRKLPLEKDFGRVRKLV